MNKSQLIDALAARLGDRRTAASAVDGLLSTIVETVQSGESVSLTGFGVFEARARAARVGRNPRTGQTVAVPAATVPAFRAGTAFKTAVGGSAPAAAPAVVEAPAKPAKASKAKATAKADTKADAKKAKKDAKKKSKKYGRSARRVRVVVGRAQHRAREPEHPRARLAGGHGGRVDGQPLRVSSPRARARRRGSPHPGSITAVTPGTVASWRRRARPARGRSQ